MDQVRIGQFIRTLRKECRMTQSELAAALGVTDQAVSKWERGLGCPDVSLLPGLSQALGAPVDDLLSGSRNEREKDGGNMRNIRFYICPQCGNLIIGTALASLSCCGRTLEPLPIQNTDEAHQLIFEAVEDEWFLTSTHPMKKDHYLSFVALVTADQVTLLKRWPEWDFQARLPRRGHGILFWHCTEHGLFRKII